MTLPSPYRPALLAALVALLLYAITLKGTFIEDDVIAIREDPRLHEPGQWRQLFYTQYWHEESVDNLYRPLVSLSFALQCHLTGDNPMPLHAVNWVLNAVVAAMVAELARRLTGPSAGNAPAYLAGLFFALHPIHVEAVAGLVGRAESMCAIGILGALILLLHRPITIARSFAVIGCLLLALFSKEQGMLLPLLMLLLPVSLGVDRPRSERERRAVLMLVLGVCSLTAAYILFRNWKFPFEWEAYFLDFSEQPMKFSHGPDRVLMPLVLLGHYAQLLVFPIKLSPDYGGLVIGWLVRLSDPYLYAGAVVAIAYLITISLLALHPRSTRQTRACLFCLLAAGALYGIVGNTVSIIATNFAERLMYLPTAFLAVVAGIGLMKLPRALMIVVVAVAVLAGSIRTFTYARQWNDRLRFYELASAAQPKSVRLHMLVAVESLSQGRLAEAEAADRAGRDSLPGYADVWIQSAQIAISEHKFDDADRYLDQAMKLLPGTKVGVWRANVAAARAREKAQSN